MCDDSWPCSRLIQDIADYLNEYDDDGDGRWLPATPELVEKISRDANHRRLLGMEEIGAAGTGRPAGRIPQNPHRPRPTRPRRVPLARRLRLRNSHLANTFHAGVGKAREIPETCHLILNPELMDQKCIAHIIGDVFLEWLHCEMRRSAPIHEIR